MLALIRRLAAFQEVPGYRLEPRIDALIAPYLAALLQVDQKDLVPELPIPRSLAKPNAPISSYRPVHVDFLVIAQDTTWHLVELKVASSYNAEQFMYLTELSRTDCAVILRGIETLFLKTQRRVNKARYLALCERLERAGVPLGPPLVHYVAPTRVIEALPSSGGVIRHKLSALSGLVRAGSAPWQLALGELLDRCDRGPSSRTT